MAKPWYFVPKRVSRFGRAQVSEIITEPTAARVPAQVIVAAAAQEAEEGDPAAVLNMLKATNLIIVVPLCFTLLVAWFSWTTFHSAPQIAAENLRGAGLTISAAIEQLAAADPSFRSLVRYSAPDIAYFALIDQQGVIRFHTNPGLIGEPYVHYDDKTLPDGISEQRARLGTGEEVYLLRTKIHHNHGQYLFVLALHTYRADNIIRRARTGVTVVLVLTASLWGLTAGLLYMLRREEQRRKEMRRREELARLGEMGAVMAHEIRNPLAGIKGFAQLAQMSGSLEKTHGYADIIVSQSLRMEALVNDLLAFTHENREERQVADLSELVDDCVTMIRVEAEPAHVQIEHASHPPLKCRVVADRITQMLLNLMKNGLQSMPDGGLLKIGMEQSGKTARITIADSGIGIPPEDLPHIFEPFWTSKARGTGLGLALCRKVAEEHGGSLRIESTEGAGTIVTVVLPLDNCSKKRLPWNN